MPEKPSRMQLSLSALLCGFALVLVAAPRLEAQGVPDGYADELVAKARELGLAEDPTWLNLLHVRPSIWGRRSTIDDPQYFLAPGGKRHPQAELEATLRAFFLPAPTNDSPHAVCRFVARFEWLKEKLAIDTRRLPVASCAAFDEVYRFLQPTSVALVYPSAFMNGPASMFGHTLLVFDSQGRNRLLSRAVSYAARTTETIGPLFAFYGMFGLYPGYYAYQPYYDKVEQYGDIGHRDVWEYELDLTQAEIDRMLQHAWELQGIWSRYFFFSENCANNLLYLLDVARPSLGLTANQSWFVIPIDTVRDVEQRALVRKVVYRPSPVTEIRHLAAALPPSERELSLRIVRGEASPGVVTNEVADPEHQRAVLDLGVNYIQYLFTEEQLGREAYNAQLFEALKVRSKLGKAEAPWREIPTPVRPDRGHGALRTALGVGAQAGEAFASAKYRIANHGLVDQDDGFTPGSHIQFLDTEARWYENERVELEHVDVVEVISLAPRDDFFQPSSWKFRFGVEQLEFGAEDSELAPVVNTGVGGTWPAPGNGLAWALIEAEADLADSYRADFAGGMGPSVGWLGYVRPGWKQRVQARALWMFAGDDLERYDVAWNQDLRLRANLSFTTEVRHRRNDGHTVNEAQAGLNFYF